MKNGSPKHKIVISLGYENQKCVEALIDLAIFKLCRGLHSGLRDRSFFMREGGLVGFGGGGALEKNWLERGGQPKKNEGKGGGVGRKN